MNGSDFLISFNFFITFLI